MSCSPVRRIVLEVLVSFAVAAVVAAVAIGVVEVLL